MTTARALLTTWSAGITCLVWLLPPGDWRLLAIVPALGTYGVWRATAAPGRHAGPGGTSPLPGPVYAAPGPVRRVLGCSCGVQSGEHKLWCVPADAELDWRARNGELPRGERPGQPGNNGDLGAGLTGHQPAKQVPVAACTCEPDPDDVWPESEHPSPPFLPAVPLSAAESAAAGEVPGPAAADPQTGPPPGASPADGWDEASLQELREAPSVLDEPQWHYRSERLADTGEIFMAPIRAEWAAQLEDQDADARSFLLHLAEGAMNYRLGLAGAR